MSILRQVFGSSRPKDIWRSLISLEKLTTRPIIHILYWLGLAIFVIAACGVLGISIGTAINETLPWGIFLALPVLIIGWFSIMIGILIWRAFCEFFMAVLNIAEDLRYIRQYQERYDAENTEEPALKTQAQQDPFTSDREPFNPSNGRDEGDSEPSSIRVHLDSEDPFFSKKP